MSVRRLKNLILICLSVAGCSKPTTEKPVSLIYKEFKDTITMKEGSSLKIINFADIQIDTPTDLNEGHLLNRLITTAIRNEQPDVITFSGDNAWRTNMVESYKKICNFMDIFDIPYYFVFGNHDTVDTNPIEIHNVINSSKNGYFKNETWQENRYGDYVVKINNSNNELVHALLMMDSGIFAGEVDHPITFVEDPVDGMKYGSYFGRKAYGSCLYDGIKEKQIDWYKAKTSELKVDSTIIAHIPIIQYSYAYEEYLRAQQSLDTAKLEEMAPVGRNRIHGDCCSLYYDTGLFTAMKENGTKNYICGHDHENDFSLVYEGVRLTYAVKTGDECSWGGPDMCGYTKLLVDEQGKTTLSQEYLYV